jgi:hypothetical protein
MRSRSAPGRSRLTWKTTSGLIAAVAILTPLAALYIYQAFANPSPELRILLRTIPVAPVAVWVLWFDRSRPFESASPELKQLGRLLALATVLGFAVLVLGFGLNWLYDPTRGL